MQSLFSNPESSVFYSNASAVESLEQVSKQRKSAIFRWISGKIPSFCRSEVGAWTW